MAFQIEFAASVSSQLDGLTANQRTRIVDAIEKQLRHTPLVETRNRKKLRPNPIAPWELRVGEFRVFYDAVEVGSDPDSENAESQNTVHILAVGRKTGNVLRIAGKEVEL